MTNDRYAQDLAQDIHKLACSVGEKRDTLNCSRLDLGKREAQLILEIWAAKDESGKPLYGNDKTRGAALTLRCDEDQQYSSMLAAVMHNEVTLTELVAKLELKRNLFRLALIERKEALTSLL